MVADAGARCATCGNAPAAGVGSARARLAVVAAPMAGDAAEMFDRMLVKVLMLERGDIFTLQATDCIDCRRLVARQIERVGPRAVLAMGASAHATVGVDGIGTWKGAVMPTFHPDELALRPQDKRAAMDHLNLVRARL